MRSWMISDALTCSRTFNGYESTTSSVTTPVVVKLKATISSTSRSVKTISNAESEQLFARFPSSLWMIILTIAHACRRSTAVQTDIKEMTMRACLQNAKSSKVCKLYLAVIKIVPRATARASQLVFGRFRVLPEAGAAISDSILRSVHGCNKILHLKPTVQSAVQTSMT
eukprot:6201052-Pleurochrysis_carterae.AAC.2